MPDLYAPEERERLACRASTLEERLGEAFVPAGSELGRQLSASRWARWEEILGGPEALERRLRWDGLQADEVKARLGSVLPAPGSAVPPWIATLEQILSGDPPLPSPPGGETWPSPAQGLPFGELLAPFLEHGWRGLPHLDLLGEAAARSLKDSLARRLSLPLGCVLLERFRARREARPTPAGSNELYAEFVQGLQKGGLGALFLTYSALARHLVLRLESWRAATVEFLERLAADRPALEERYGGLRVVELFPDQGDAHEGGRTVLGLELEGGARLYYKPRPGGAFAEVVRWLNQRTGTDLRNQDGLLRPTHGWMEDVRPGPLGSSEEASRFYCRAGSLLALLYALQATDCHCENLVASGQHPVLVDDETLFGVPLAVPTSAILKGYRESVLATLLLPFWFTDESGAALESSGLYGSGPETGLKPVWSHLGTDRIELSQVAGEPPARLNRPLLEGEPLAPASYPEELCHGFRRTYGQLLLHSPELPSAAARLLEQPLRLVCRATRNYYLLWRRLGSPPLFRQEVDRSLELEWLSRAYVASDARPASWPLARAERLAAEHRDVPLFRVDFQRGQVTSRYGQAPASFLGTPREGLAERLSRMGPLDCARQVRLLRTSLATSLEPPLSSLEGPPASLSEAALALGEELAGQALQEDGRLGWWGLSVVPGTDRLGLRAAGPYLYDGLAGLALFFAALEKVRGGGFGSLSLSLLEQLAQDLEQIPRPAPLGALTGLASLQLAALRVEALTLDRGLGEAFSERVLEELESRLEDPQVGSDLMSGWAGIILVQLECHRAPGRSRALELAARAGRVLLSRRVEGSPGLRAWTSLEGRLLAGLGHGAAGIALALFRLSAALGQPEFSAAAAEAVAWEESLRPPGGDFPDLRGGSGPPLHAWCTGNPGIGLSRLEALDVYDSPQVRSDLELALESAGTASSGLDHLCCGRLGRCELLLQAGVRLSRPELVQRARALASDAVERARRSGAYRLVPRASGPLLRPGLFQGQAGVGYELLRLEAPGEVPSILAFGGSVTPHTECPSGPW